MISELAHLNDTHLNGHAKHSPVTVAENNQRNNIKEL